MEHTTFGVVIRSSLSALALSALALPAAAQVSTRAASPAWPNEPPGFVTTIDEDLSGKSLPDAVAGAWEYSSNWSGSGVVAEGGALRWVWPAGRAGGDSPGRAVVQTTGHQFRSYYIGVRVRWSVPWTAHGSGANKILYWGSMEARRDLGHGPSQFYLNRRGNVIDLTLQYAQRNGQSNVPAGSQRRAHTRVDDGAWHLIELLIEGNEAGRANCRTRVWVDDVLNFDVGGLVCARGEALFYGINLDPIWGGIGERKPRDEWIEMDHVRVSGLPDAPEGAWPREPGGLSLIAEDDWSAAGTWQPVGAGEEVWSANGWTRTSEDVSVVDVEGLPTETSRALEVRTRAGTPGGRGPSVFHPLLPPDAVNGGPYREVYLGYWTRLARGFTGHPSGMNGHAAVLVGRPGGTDAFQAMAQGEGIREWFNLRLEGTVGLDDSPCPYTFSTAAAVLRPGRWQRVELWYRKPDDDGNGGQWRVWIDGTLIQENDEVCDYGFSPARSLVGVEFRGTWGGSGGTLPTDNVQHVGPFRLTAR